MSVTDGLGRVPIHWVDGMPIAKKLVGKFTLAGDKTLTVNFRPVLAIDPGGAHRNVLLPPEQNGIWFFIVNKADAAVNLVIQNDAGGAVETLNQNEAGLYWCDGTTWYVAAHFTGMALT